MWEEGVEEGEGREGYETEEWKGRKWSREEVERRLWKILETNHLREIGEIRLAWKLKAKHKEIPKGKMGGYYREG